MDKDDEYVKIVEICRVAHLPSPNASKLLPFTFFDIIILPYPPATSHLYFYQNSINIINVLPNFKHSLPLILTITHYLPLAGNLIWPQLSHKPIIQFLERRHRFPYRCWVIWPRLSLPHWWRLSSRSQLSSSCTNVIYGWWSCFCQGSPTHHFPKWRFLHWNNYSPCCCRWQQFNFLCQIMGLGLQEQS